MQHAVSRGRAGQRDCCRHGCRARAPERGPEGPRPVAPLGAVPQRARVGHRARGLQRDGDAWDYFPHDHARSRAYRWSEDGLAGICDDRQTLCFALAFWNGRDPILKERIFGLTGPRGEPRRGRQGVLVVPRLDADALVDAVALHVPAGGVPVRTARRRRTAAAASTTPSSSWSTPASSTTAATGRSRPTTRRPRPTTSSSASRVRNAGPEPATIDVLPTLWFRNTWSWGSTAAKPRSRLEDGALVASTTARHALLAASGSPEALFCENETNAERLFGRRELDAVPEGRDQRPRRRTAPRR